MPEIKGKRERESEREWSARDTLSNVLVSATGL